MSLSFFRPSISPPPLVLTVKGRNYSYGQGGPSSLPLRIFSAPTRSVSGVGSASASLRPLPTAAVQALFVSVLQPFAPAPPLKIITSGSYTDGALFF